MEFDYTEHAKENITERKLSKEAIEEVVKNPEKVTEGKFGRKIAQKNLGKKLLRVVYERRGKFMSLLLHTIQSLKGIRDEYENNIRP